MRQKIIFVNGFLFPLTYPGGPGYWLGEGSDFVAGAKAFLKSDVAPHFTDIKHPKLSAVADRVLAGRQYAEQYKRLITEGGEQFSFVTHSMGAAFAEGMIAYLQENHYPVNTVIHFNAFQAADIQLNRKAYVIDYQNTNDPLINNVLYAKPGAIKDADLVIREKSKKNYFKRHRDPIDSGDSWLLIRPST
jgi:hypothetical protein